MEIAPLTLEDAPAWAELLATAFDRRPADMRQLLGWIHQGRELVAWGAWDADRLVAQYACLLTRLYLPHSQTIVEAGMSLNMAVHPDYRGRGLIKQVSKPVYDAIQARGGLAGVGFSNANGVKVDRHSQSYGYQVCGQLQPALAWIPPRRSRATLELTDTLPPSFHCPTATLNGLASFVNTDQLIYHRYAQHPFRRYRFGLWRAGNSINGLIVYRPVKLARQPGAALLGAYGADLDELVFRWVNTIRQQGLSLVQLLTSPHAPLKAALAHITVCLTLPYARQPYYLTIKPLRDSFPTPLLQLSAWNCVGGDIL